MLLYSKRVRRRMGEAPGDGIVQFTGAPLEALPLPIGFPWGSSVESSSASPIDPRQAAKARAKMGSIRMVPGYALSPQLRLTECDDFLDRAHRGGG